MNLVNWFTANYVETVGAFFGLVYIYFSIKQNIWLWPVGILSSAFYIWVFFFAKFYADMSLNFYYLIISIYGWIFWLRGKKSENTETEELPISRTNGKTTGVLSGVTVILFFAMWYVLKNFTDSPVPVGDAFVTALSITATWMLTKKKIEQWLIWIVVDFISLGLFYYKGFRATLILFAVYTVMAFVGYFKWRKDLLSLTIVNR